MSIKVTSQVWDLQLSHAQRLVLLALADYADETGGHVYPSVMRVAWKAGYSKRQTQRIMRGLEESGLLVLVAEANGIRPTTYRIDVGAGSLKPQFRAADHKLSRSMRRQVIAEFNQTCRHCQKRGNDTHGPDGRPWHVDRLLPGQSGGVYEWSNVVLACATCNQKRSNEKGVPKWHSSDGVPSGTDGVPSDAPGGAIQMTPEPSVEPSVEPSPSSPSERKRARIDQDALPGDFPDDLAERVGPVLEVLSAIQSMRGGRTPTTRAVGLAILREPRADHLLTARKLEHYLTAGNGLRMSCADVASRFADWVEREGPADRARLMVVPSQRESASDLIRALEAS